MYDWHVRDTQEFVVEDDVGEPSTKVTLDRDGVFVFLSIWTKDYVLPVTVGLSPDQAEIISGTLGYMATDARRYAESVSIREDNKKDEE